MRKCSPNKGSISQNDANEIIRGLDQILQDINNNNFEFDEALEDIHMNIEARLTERIGAPGRQAAYRTLKERSGRYRRKTLPSIRS
jgi:argininosuccinate lyase